VWPEGRGGSVRVGLGLGLKAAASSGFIIARGVSSGLLRLFYLWRTPRRCVGADVAWRGGGMGSRAADRAGHEEAALRQHPPVRRARAGLTNLNLATDPPSPPKLFGGSQTLHHPPNHPTSEGSPLSLGGCGPFRQDLAFFDVNKTGELANRLSTDVHEVAEHLVENFSQFLSAVVRGTMATRAWGVSALVACMRAGETTRWCDQGTLSGAW
jgi:hypothetical protein